MPSHLDSRTTWTVPALSAVLVLPAALLAGCGGGAATDGTEKTVTVTVTRTLTLSQTTDGSEGWDPSRQSGHAGKAPPFPEQLDGWRLADEWSSLTRAFTESWTVVGGPDREPANGRFPASSNGCADGMFLVRWRAVNNLPIRLTAANGSEPLDGSPPLIDPAGVDIASVNGWAVLDGCHSPVIQMIDASNGSSLQDVAFEIQEWDPAP